MGGGTNKSHDNQMNYRDTMQILQLITNPRSFFASLNTGSPSLKWPVLLVTLVGVFSAITGYQMGELTGRLLAGMMPGLGSLTAIMTAVSSFFGPYLMWIIAALIFYAIQRFQKGTGSFRQVLGITGYGMTPLILAALIGVFLAFYYLPMVEIEPIFSNNPDQINAAVKSMILDPALHQFSLISSLLTIILLIWSANLWAFGFESCCSLDSRKAMITAGVPTLIYIIYTLASLFLFNQVF